MKTNTKKMVMMGVLTAIVFALQFVSMAIRTATFSITLSLVPIVIGAALYGKWAGAWLGGVFGLAVFATHDADAFLTLSVVGTIVTVMAKGILSGFAAGCVYDALKAKNDTVATYIAGIVTPIVNTGVFIIGCYAFFFDVIKDGANGGSTFKYVIIAFVGFNFLIELGVNLVLSPTIAKVIKIGRKETK